jgi:hypothetical protein
MVRASDQAPSRKIPIEYFHRSLSWVLIFGFLNSENARVYFSCRYILSSEMYMWSYL